MKYFVHGKREVCYTGKHLHERDESSRIVDGNFPYIFTYLSCRQREKASSISFSLLDHVALRTFYRSSLEIRQINFAGIYQLINILEREPNIGIDSIKLLISNYGKGTI